MPAQFWKHQCPGQSPLRIGSFRPCACGEPLVYDGWYNTRLEAMAWRQKFCGLKPIGPHRPLADHLFADCSTPCVPCEGRGYFDTADGLGFDACTVCEGAGYRSTISPAERAARRAQVLAVFPDAAAPFDLPNPAFSAVSHDLRHNVMLAFPMLVDRQHSPVGLVGN